jgi:hypothetical protein
VVEVYDELDETMMYSEVDDATSSGNVSQQATGVYIDFDDSLISNYDYPTVGRAAARPGFIHINITIVRLIITRCYHYN